MGGFEAIHSLATKANPLEMILFDPFLVMAAKTTTTNFWVLWASEFNRPSFWTLSVLPGKISSVANMRSGCAIANVFRLCQTEQAACIFPLGHNRSHVEDKRAVSDRKDKTGAHGSLP